MKKKPLNQAVRLLILEAVLNHRFSKQKKELDKQSAKFGDMIYNELLSPNDRKRMNESPDNWFDTTTNICVYVNGTHGYYEFTTRRRKPCHWNKVEKYGNVQLMSGVSPSATVITAFRRDEEKYNADYQAARMAVSATLKAYKFIEDLIEQWPEVKKFVPKDEAKSATMALAIPPKQLNEMLGLS